MSRQSDDWENWLKAAGVIGYLLLQGLAALKKRRGEQAPAPAPAAPPPIEPFRVALLEAVRGLGTRSDQILTQARGLQARLARLQSTLPVRALSEATETHVVVMARALVTQLDTLDRAAVAADDVAILQRIDAEGVRLGLRSAVEHLEQRLHALTVAADARSDRERAGLIADAEAVAMDLLEPLRTFARSLPGNPLAERPICLPSADGDESVWPELLPGNPLIIVPADLAERLPRWAALPHEIGHVIHQRWPGYAAEARTVFGAEGEGHLPVLVGEGQVEFDPDEAFAAWHGEMLADAFAALTFGPAALQGLVTCFARPDAPDEVCRAHTAGARFSPHPPAHLRVLWMVWLLERMGYEVEPRALLGAWTRLHGRPEVILLPVRPRHGLRVPVNELFEAGRLRLAAWYEHPWACFDQCTLPDISGLELTPGMWQRVRRHGVELIRGEPVVDAPRLVLAAAVEAGGRTPSATRGIAAAARASIQGLDSGERRPADAHYRVGTARKRPSGGLGELQSALILREILARRPAWAPPFTGRSGRGGC